MFRKEKVSPFYRHCNVYKLACLWLDCERVRAAPQILNLLVGKKGGYNQMPHPRLNTKLTFTSLFFLSVIDKIFIWSNKVFYFNDILCTLSTILHLISMKIWQIAERCI